MNGQSVLVDTNVLVFLLNGDSTASKLLFGKDISISFITEIELGSIPNATNRNPSILTELFDAVSIIHSNPIISKQATLYRHRHRIPVPDAIIAATAKFLSLPLISADKVFLKIPDIRVVEYRTKMR